MEYGSSLKATVFFKTLLILYENLKPLICVLLCFFVCFVFKVMHVPVSYTCQHMLLLQLIVRSVRTAVASSFLGNNSTQCAAKPKAYAPYLGAFSHKGMPLNFTKYLNIGWELRFLN